MSLSLVTGGAGFVGSHLVAELTARGESVRVLDLSPTETSDGVRGSVADPDIARTAVDGVDYIFHLAGNAQLWALDESIFDEVNHLGTRVMLAAAREARVKRFIHCSSLTTLVGRSTPIGESNADEAVSLDAAEMLGAYPRSKRLAELAVEEAVAAGLDAVVAIPTEPLGAGDLNLTPPTRMIVDFLNGASPAYIDCLLNFVPVASLAEGMIAARDLGKSGQRYLLGGENVPMQRLLETLGDLSGRSMPTMRLPYWVAQLAGVIDTGVVSRVTRRAPRAPLTGVRLAGRRASFSSEKAERELNWRVTPFEPALQQTIQWMRRTGLVN